MVRDDRRVTRRSFLQSTSSLATAAAALGAMKAAESEGTAGDVKTDDRPFKLGIIGCGAQGQKLMNEALKIPGNSFTAVCDVIPKRRQAAVKIARSQAGGFEDYRELLDKAEIDGLIIATPLHLHHAMTMAAFERGLDVFCEKTMAYSIEQCQKMHAAALGKHVLQIGHHLRYHPIYELTKIKFIDSNKIGKITHIQCQWNRNASWRRTPTDEEKAGVDWKKWGYEDTDQLFNWRLFRQYSGGLMTELASHQLDVVNWFLGATPVAVVGAGQTDHDDGRTIFDNVDLIFEYPNGVKVTYQSITKNAYNPYGWEAFEMIKGEKGTLIMTHLAKNHTGLYFREPGVPAPLWAGSAKTASFNPDNLRRDEYRKAFVIGKPTSGLSRIAGIDVADLVDTSGYMPNMTTYQLEMLDFKRCALDQTIPKCDSKIGLHSAVPVLIGLQAMEQNRRIAIPAKTRNLVAPARPA